MFELLPNTNAVKTALFLEKSKTLVVGDLHIGFEQSLRDGGALLIKEQSKYIKTTLEKLIRNTGAKTIVLNGDIKHEFGKVNIEEATDFYKLLKWMQTLVEVKIILGNHDKLTKAMVKKKGLKSNNYLIIDNCLIFHGDSTLEDLKLNDLELSQVETIVIGHEHPSLNINDGIRNEKVKCFLLQKHYKIFGGNKVNLIVMPSFNNLTKGSAVVGGRPLGPFLTSYSGFSAFAVFNDRILAFGKLEDLQRLMSGS